MNMKHLYFLEKMNDYKGEWQGTLNFNKLDVHKYEASTNPSIFKIIDKNKK